MSKDDTTGDGLPIPNNQDIAKSILAKYTLSSGKGAEGKATQQPRVDAPVLPDVNASGVFENTTPASRISGKGLVIASAVIGAILLSAYVIYGGSRVTESNQAHEVPLLVSRTQVPPPQVVNQVAKVESENAELRRKLQELQDAKQAESLYSPQAEQNVQRYTKIFPDPFSCPTDEDVRVGYMFATATTIEVGQVVRLKPGCTLIAFAPNVSDIKLTANGGYTFAVPDPNRPNWFEKNGNRNGPNNTLEQTQNFLMQYKHQEIRIAVFDGSYVEIIAK